MPDLDEQEAATWVREQVAAARRAHGDRLVLAPSCSVVESAPQSLLDAFREAAAQPLG